MPRACGASSNHNPWSLTSGTPRILDRPLSRAMTKYIGEMDCGSARLRDARPCAVDHEGVELPAVLLELGEGAAGEPATARELEAHGTARGVVDDNFKMQVWPGQSPGRADEADDLALADAAAD